MGQTVYWGRVEVLERLHAAGGDINFTDSVSVINLDIAAVFSQIVCIESEGVLCCGLLTLLEMD